MPIYDDALPLFPSQNNRYRKPPIKFKQNQNQSLATQTTSNHDEKSKTNENRSESYDSLVLKNNPSPFAIDQCERQPTHGDNNETVDSNGTASLENDKIDNETDFKETYFSVECNTFESSRSMNTDLAALSDGGGHIGSGDNDNDDDAKVNISSNNNNNNDKKYRNDHHDRIHRRKNVQHIQKITKLNKNSINLRKKTKLPIPIHKKHDNDDHDDDNHVVKRYHELKRNSSMNLLMKPLFGVFVKSVEFAAVMALSSIIMDSAFKFATFENWMVGQEIVKGTVTSAINLIGDAESVQNLITTDKFREIWNGFPSFSPLSTSIHSVRNWLTLGGGGNAANLTVSEHSLPIYNLVNLSTKTMNVGTAKTASIVKSTIPKMPTRQPPNANNFVSTLAGLSVFGALASVIKRRTL